MLRKSLLSLTILCSIGASAATVHAEDLLQKALVDDASHYLKFRYRFESVDQDGTANNATASTLRSSLGYKTGEIHGFSATVEAQNVVKLGSDDYNDSINGKTTYPTVADPDVTEITKAFLSFSGIQDTLISIGRQQYNFDNMRFINNNNWRQHHQTYDSISLVNTSLPDTKAHYVYVNKLNRSNGGDHPTGSRNMNTHLVNINYSGWEYGSLVGYGYLQDYDTAALFGLSSKTFGTRFTGSAPINDDLKALYTAEYAIQSDHGDNAANYDTDYHLAELGLGGSNWSVKVGYEVLAADGTNGVFTTPLGTGHGFHGWADKFVTVPTTGIEDTHVKISYTLKSADTPSLDGVKFDARYHQFDAEQGGADYGSEVDFRVSKKFMDNYSASLTYADYNANTFATDTQKIFLILGASF